MKTGILEKSNRLTSFLLITGCYIPAALLGIWLYDLVRGPAWLSLLVADLGATVFIWVMSEILKNASVYDPYWSVQPPIILALALLTLAPFHLGSLLLVLVVSFWGARLSFNWMLTFHGLHKQDWRYDKLERQSGAFFPLVNLLGIQVMPTLIVYACLLPGFYFILRGGGLNAGTVAGLLMILGGAILEMAADLQLQTFRQQCDDRTCLFREGLWACSRHPNYLGEIMVWWGVYGVLLSIYPDLWFLGLGALTNTGLFLFISIPMAEKHLGSYKAGYGDYQLETPRLLPFIGKRG